MLKINNLILKLGSNNFPKIIIIYSIRKITNSSNNLNSSNINISSNNSSHNNNRSRILLQLQKLKIKIEPSLP